MPTILQGLLVPTFGPFLTLFPRTFSLTLSLPLNLVYIRGLHLNLLCASITFKNVQKYLQQKLVPSPMIIPLDDTFLQCFVRNQFLSFEFLESVNDWQLEKAKMFDGARFAVQEAWNGH